MPEAQKPGGSGVWQLVVAQPQLGAQTAWLWNTETGKVLFLTTSGSNVSSNWEVRS